MQYSALHSQKGSKNQPNQSKCFKCYSVVIIYHNNVNVHNKQKKTYSTILSKQKSRGLISFYEHIEYSSRKFIGRILSFILSPIVCPLTGLCFNYMFFSALKLSDERSPFLLIFIICSYLLPLHHCPRLRKVKRQQISLTPPHPVIGDCRMML